jgi:hypothetical protein
MTTAREGHTATLLSNGKVLIAGGSQTGPTYLPLASAELYDPSTGTFAATGDMTTPRTGHTATLLPDGRVLIVGGNDVVAGKATAELYDPSTGTFIATGNPVAARYGLVATLVANGKVLVAGSYTASVELYDPATGSFAVTGAYAGSYANPVLGTATLLPDGTVFITGCDCGNSLQPLIELYHPDTGRFGLNANLGGTVYWWNDTNTATLLMNGKILVAGSDDLAWVTPAVMYDPSTGTFTSVGNAIAPHEFSTATFLPDGTVLIAGSQQPGGYAAGGVDLYAPATGMFYNAPNMTTPRFAHTATLLRDGTVLIAGGYSTVIHTAFGNSLVPTASAEIYKPPVLQAAPVLLPLSGGGQGQGAIQHAGTYRIASAEDPAVAGEYLSIYLTGLADGSVIPPQVAIGGRLAEITFFGDVPGYPGLDVINVRMPGGVAPGPAVPVRLMYLSRPSNEVTIGAQ